MRAALVINPAAGRGAGREFGPAIARYLAELNVVTQPSYSLAAGDLVMQVKQALARHVDAVIVAGGDGTIHHAVNGWMQAGGGAPLAFVPIGTGNDFMKMLPSGSDWREACRRIATAKMRHLDLGRCSEARVIRKLSGDPRSTELPEASGEHCSAFYFANTLGIGFNARVAIEANRMQWLRGNLVYGAAVAKVLVFSHLTPKVRVHHDGDTVCTRITLLAVGNGSTEGGAFRLAPQAHIDDGLFDVVLARGMSRLRILALIPQVIRGTHLNDPDVMIFRTARLVIESESGLPVHADGEIRFTDATQLTIEILPRQLTVIA